MPSRGYFLVGGGGIHDSKSRRLRELHLHSIKQYESDPGASPNLPKTEGGDQMDTFCANCEHDLTPPIVNSTRHGSTR